MAISGVNTKSVYFGLYPSLKNALFFLVIALAATVTMGLGARHFSPFSMETGRIASGTGCFGTVSGLSSPPTTRKVVELSYAEMRAANKDKVDIAECQSHGAWTPGQTVHVKGTTMYRSLGGEVAKFVAMLLGLAICGVLTLYCLVRLRHAVRGDTPPDRGAAEQPA